MTDELDDRQALAAEYVLGTLDQAGRRRAEQLIARDPDFAGQVGAWNRRLGPLLLAIPPETPSPAVWQSIQAVLERRAPVPAGAPAAPRRHPKAPLLERLGFWRWCTLGASAVAAGLAIFIAVGQLAPPPEQATRFIAVLNQDGADPSWLVTVDIATQELTIRPVAPGAAPDQAPDQALELWLVAADGARPPRSLGLLNRESEVSLAFPAVARPAEPETAVLAISLEPPGGSPTGLPTGPVVFSGKILPVSNPAAGESAP